MPIGRATRPFLDALGIQHVTADRPDGAEDSVRLAGWLAFGTRHPAACLLPRSLTATGNRLTRDRPVGGRGTAPRVHPGGAPHGGLDDLVATREPGGPPMTRLEATRLLVGRLRDEPVIAALEHPAYDLYAAGDRPRTSTRGAAWAWPPRWDSASHWRGRTAA